MRRAIVAPSPSLAVLGYEKGTIRRTGRVYEREWVHVFTLRDGAIVRHRLYGDTTAVTAALEGV